MLRRSVLLALITAACGLRIAHPTRRVVLSGATGLLLPLAPPLALPAWAFVDSSPLCDPCVTTVRSKGGQEIVLVGTAHISEDSATLVRRVIREIRPDTVMIELDASRASRLMQRRQQTAVAVAADAAGTVAAASTPATAAPISAAAKRPAFGMGQVVGRLFKGDFEEASSQAVGVGLSQMYRQLDEMGFQSGGEFVAAVEEADSLGASILLGDRDARLTVKRLRDALVEVLQNPPDESAAPPPDALVAALGGSKANNDFTKENVQSTMAVLKQRENVRLLTAYLRESVPPLYEALIAERDQYMANSILRSDAKRLVAVVGLAHVDGIAATVTREGGSSGSSGARACAR